MIAVIPMAGEGQRFQDRGYGVPKPLLPMPDGRTLIEHVMESLPPMDAIYTVTRLGFIHQFFAIDTILISVVIKRKTAGPLDTILEAKQYMRGDDELLINYCDCFLPDNQCQEFVNEMRQRKRLAGVVCFPSHDERFQREPSGQFSMSGIYWFKSAREFVRQAKHYREDGRVSPGHIALSTMFYAGLNMGAAFITNNIVDLGTPEAYELYMALHKTKDDEIESK